MGKSNKNDKIGEIIAKIKTIKHIKILLILVIAAIVLWVIGSVIGKNETIVSFGKKSTTTETATIQNTSVSYTEEERKLADILTQIQGVGETHVMITYKDKEIVKGVIVVAEGADRPVTEWKIRHAVQTALQVDYQNIEVYSIN